jgi:MFS family permease
MAYLGELRTSWRYLVAVCLGQGAGISFTNYIANLFTPHLLNAFGWTRADIAAAGATAALGIIFQPIAGRLTDTFGVRRMALIGVITLPLVYVGFSMMNGVLGYFFVLMVIMYVVAGTTTGPTVYSRLIAENFTRTRGLALALGACTPPAAVALLAPTLAGFMDTHGFRAGYVVMAVFFAVGGTAALLLIPGGEKEKGLEHVGKPPSESYGEVLKKPALHLIMAGIVLCNLSFMMQTTHLKVIMLERGIDSETGSMAVSLFAISVIVGRITTGLALDRFPAHLVAALSMLLPGLGLTILATGKASPVMIAASVVMFGFSFGADGDIIAYLAMKYFRLEIYSTIVGFALASLSFSTSAGTALMSLMLKITGSYTPFIIFTAVAAFLGSGAFLLLGRHPTIDRAAPVPVAA